MAKYFDQVDFSAEHIYSSGDFLYKRVITNTATVKSSAGFIERIILGNTAPTTVKIYDTSTILSTSLGLIRNTVSKVSFASAPSSFNIGAKCSKGIRVLISTASDLTFLYR